MTVQTVDGVAGVTREQEFGLDVQLGKRKRTPTLGRLKEGGGSNSVDLMWEVMEILRFVASVGEPMGLLVTSLGVSNVEKEGMYIGIARRIRYVFTVIIQVISSPVVLFWRWREFMFQRP